MGLHSRKIRFVYGEDERIGLKDEQLNYNQTVTVTYNKKNYIKKLSFNYEVLPH